MQKVTTMFNIFFSLFRLNYHNSMLTVFSSSNLHNIALHTSAQSSYLSANCILTPYSELAKRLLSNSYITCNHQQSAFSKYILQYIKFIHQRCSFQNFVLQACVSDYFALRSGMGRTLFSIY